MSITADMFYSIRSPYSYLGIQRLDAVVAGTALDQRDVTRSEGREIRCLTPAC